MTDATLSQALKEAYASADQVRYLTLEFLHPNFIEPLRVVTYREENLTATLEPDAPENGGEAVLFVAYPFEYKAGEVAAGTNPEFEFVIDNVDRRIVSSIEASLESLEPITVIIREYLESDLSAPQNDPPLQMDVIKISATPLQIQATASFINLANQRFPADIYDAKRFPGLVA